VTTRAERVATQIRNELADLIQRGVKDPRVGFASITEVTVTPDLRQARVRVSVLGDEAAVNDTIAGLESAKGWIRHELGQRLENLRYAPELRFEADQRIAEAQRISDILREVLPPDEPRP
jgi:ribosome-binding factor A